MIGWFLEVDSLTRIIPTFVSMKFLTAFSFFLSGLLLLHTERLIRKPYSYSQVVVPGLTLTLLLIMMTLLISALLGFKSGFENLFVSDPGDLLTVVPGLPSIGTIAGFIITGILGLVSLNKFSYHSPLYRLGGTVLAAIAGIALLGYVLGIPALFYSIENISTAMAIHTAALFLVVGLGYILLARVVKVYST